MIGLTVLRAGAALVVPIEENDLTGRWLKAAVLPLSSFLKPEGFRSKPWTEKKKQPHRHAAGKDRKNEQSEGQSKKHTLRIITDFLIYLNFQS